MSLHLPSGSSTNVPHSIFQAWLSISSDSGVEKCLTPAGTSLPLNLLNFLSKALAPLSCAISSAFWSSVWSAGSAYLAFFPPRSFSHQVSRFQSTHWMAADRTFPTGLKTGISSPPTLCTDMETTATDKCAEMVKVKMRAFFCGTTDLLLIFEPSPRAHHSESRENWKFEKMKNHQQKHQKWQVWDKRAGLR